MDSLPSGLLRRLKPFLASFDHPGPGSYRAISLKGAAEAAAFWNTPPREALARCLEAGIWPLRFKANRGLFSDREQAALLRRHVAVIGCGGLGGHLIMLLARMGVGALTICDHDVFEESNLNRQFLCREDRLGMNKALAAKEELALTASHVEVTAFSGTADAGSLPGLLARAHAAVDCLDNFSARLALEQAAHAAGIPYIHGALAGMEGFALAFRPGERPLARLYGQKAGAAPAEHGAEKTAGTPTPVPAAVAALQAVLTARALLENIGLENAGLERVGIGGVEPDNVEPGGVEKDGPPARPAVSSGGPSALWHLDLSAPSLETLLL